MERFEIGQPIPFREGRISLDFIESSIDSRQFQKCFESELGTVSFSFETFALQYAPLFSFKRCLYCFKSDTEDTSKPRKAS